VEERIEDWMLLLTNQSSRQSPAIHGGALFDLHRLVKNLSIDKMEKGGTKHTGVPVKTLKKLLKKAGLKVSGKKATLTRRAKKAKLFGGLGAPPKSTMKSFITKTIQTNPELIASKAEAAAQQATSEADRQAALEKGEKANTILRAQQAHEDRLNDVNFDYTGQSRGGKKKRSRRS
jgi:hypothetical protein